MAEYLSKEEIRQWRSSLEKITLEEFALRLGKKIKEEKETRDIVDLVMKSAVVSKIDSSDIKEKIKAPQKAAGDVEQKLLSLRPELTFKKPLTDREKIVLSQFIENKNSIVYARDLAKILNLPTDYVYKYIKNLRTKIDENILENADKGGYRLSVK
ncbi:helix-turn-helix domain-containing protein [bacterium]|nr:helix-turn-helix domain-containing protein [bacterium]